MKKTSILLALILAFTLTLSAAADAFPDVESDHWAYEEIQDLQASGIFEGFPDGEFKGDNAFTRYEFAVAFHRALENMEDVGDVDEAVAELQDEVERLKSGLTAEQAEAVESIVEAIVEETQGSDQLTEEQAKEVAELVDQLTKGLAEEIEKIYVELDVTKRLGERRYQDNDEKIKEIQDKLAELEGSATDEELEAFNEDVESLQESIESLEEMESNVQKLGIDQESASKLSQMRFLDLREDLDQLSADFDEAIENLESDMNKQQVDLQSQSKLGKMRYEDINNNLDEISDRVSTLEEEPTFQFVDPTYSASYARTDVVGDAYIDPYNSGIDTDNLGDFQYDDENWFKHTLDFNFLVQRENFVADLELAATVEHFDGTDFEAGFSSSNLKGTITTDRLEAVIDEGQELTLKPYLFDGEFDGVVATFTDDNDDEYRYVVIEDAMAAETTMEQLLGFSPLQNELNFVFGAQKLQSINDRNLLVGMDTLIELAGFDITPELAVSSIDFDEYYFTVNASREDFGPVKNLEIVYKKDGDLVAIEPDVDDGFNPDDGYRISGGFDFLNLNLTYQDYNNTPWFLLEASRELLGFDNQFSYKNYTAEQDGTGITFDTSNEWDIIEDIFSVNVAFDYQTYGDDFVFEGDYDGAEDTFDTTLGFDYEQGMIDSEATFVHDNLDSTISQDYKVDLTFIEDTASAWAYISSPDFGDPYEQEYGAEYTPGRFGFSLQKYLNQEDDATIFFGKYNYEKATLFTLLGIDMIPFASYGYKLAPTNQSSMEAGLDLERDMTENLVVSAGYLYADKEFGHNVFDDPGFEIFQKGGILNKVTAGMNYDFADGIKGNLDYEHQDFDAYSGSDDLDDYEIKRVTGGITVEF